MSTKAELEANLAAIEARIVAACERAGRSRAEVTLIAVSKLHSVESIQMLYDAGHRDFGENYVQEWAGKKDLLPADIRWHFIGALQTKKTKTVIGDMTLIHSVDRESLVKEFSKRQPEEGAQFLIQVNTGNDVAKGGVAPELTLQLVQLALESGLKPVGLMTIPPFNEAPAVTRSRFVELRECFVAVKEQLDGPDRDRFVHLSMGMSSDFEIAIEEGATLVRVGTAIFGARVK